ncbi:MAG: haloalkane dehalogenase [Gammaproteobacteria bacterium]|nr:haloalkane dehalogenase [Gammaproteobacteria bacterium]
MSEAISAAYPYRPNYIDVYGSRMHFVDTGEGAPVLFLHGNPTWSYLWRNVIPHVVPLGRCIAPDLIGMGKSDKPALEYRIFDHIRYVDEFILALDLRDITLVVHDWGSAIGFNYARRFPERVKAIAFMEAMVLPMPAIDMFPAQIADTFRGFRSPEHGWRMIAEENMFIEQVLPGTIVRTLTPAEMAQYRMPFPTPESRRPVYRFPNELSFAGEPADVTWLIERYNAWLRASPLPKLLLHADPGVLVTADVLAWCRANLVNLTTVALGAGYHYLQEDHPHRIGRAIAQWLQARS